MSRRILPLPEDPVQNDSTAVAPTQENLRANSGILRAEKLLKQKGWRVMAPKVHATILIYASDAMLMPASSLMLFCRRRTHFSSSTPLFFSPL